MEGRSRSVSSTNRSSGRDDPVEPQVLCRAAVSAHIPKQFQKLAPVSPRSSFYVDHCKAFRADILKSFLKLLSKPGKGGASLGIKQVA